MIIVKSCKLCVSAMPPTVLTSLVKAWAEMKPPPVGILDQLVSFFVLLRTWIRWQTEKEVALIFQKVEGL